MKNKRNIARFGTKETENFMVNCMFVTPWRTVEPLLMDTHELRTWTSIIPTLD